jgi:hypothetical protein
MRTENSNCRFKKKVLGINFGNKPFLLLGFGGKGSFNPGKGCFEKGKVKHLRSTSLMSLPREGLSPFVSYWACRVYI